MRFVILSLLKRIWWWWVKHEDWST